jgi:DNA modification methylase
MPELSWDAKYQHGKKVGPVRIALPFQTIETVNESTRDRQRSLELFSAGREGEWRNRLIWGDKKYVLPSLVAELAGQVNLIYIDPPFDTGADFSFTATIPDHPDAPEDESTTFTKEPSVLEQKAYRDTWGVSREDRGRGVTSLDRYLKWFYETVVLLQELLDERGHLFVHLDYHVAHYAKAVIDEVFGPHNFRNEIILKRRITKNLQRQFETIESLPQGHDVMFWYSKTATTRVRPCLVGFDNKKPEGYWHHFWSNADRPTMRYELLGVTPKSGQWKWEPERSFGAAANYEKYLRENSGKSLLQYWEETGHELEFIRKNPKTGKVENWFPPFESRIADTIWVDIHTYENEKAYPTQKHTDLLQRIMTWACPEDGLVLDCFVGSGTTAAVAEKLGRRWVASDLGRFAIHLTRKRLLSIPNVRPFIVQNLGKYERQAWQAAEFPNPEDQRTREAAYRKFILDLYHATPITGRTWLHGTKSGRFVHVGAVDAPVTLADVKAVAAEAWKAVGSAKGAAEKAAVDILGWEFAFELNETAKDVTAQARVDIVFRKIPREVLEKKAVEQGDIRFFELAALAVDLKQKKREATLELEDFVVPPDDVPEDVRTAIRHWSQWIDYWAVDWDYKGDTFHNQWQSYRTRKESSIETKASHIYSDPGRYTVVVKVIDILGNDTTKTLVIEVR